MPLIHDRDLDGYIWAGLYAALNLLYAFFPASYFHETMTQGNVIRIQVCTLLYKKILRLNSQGASKTSVGKLINLMSNDASRYEYFLVFFPQGLFLPVALGTTMWYLYTKIGTAIFVTLGTTFFVCCVSVTCGFKMGAVRNLIAKESDARLRTLEEMINSILVTKMYSWESFALGKVIDKRKTECSLYQYRAQISGFAMALLRFAPQIMISVTFLTSLMTDTIENFRASNVFTALSFANTLVLYQRMFQYSTYVYVETLSCNARVKEALMLPEKDEKAETLKQTVVNDAVKIQFKNFSAVYPGNEKPSLVGINVAVAKSQLLGVIGPVGSGKSTLLNTAIGETLQSNGDGFVTKSVSIAPQEPWIYEGTIKAATTKKRRIKLSSFNFIISYQFFILIGTLCHRDKRRIFCWGSLTMKNATTR